MRPKNGKGNCPKCGNPKPSGKRSYCNPCNAARLATPEMKLEQRNRYLKQKYGITVSDFERMLKAQGGGCAGCGKKGLTKSLNVDHEHVKGFKNMAPEEKKKYVRGLLCHRCNRNLGMASDNPQTLRNLADFLDRYMKRRPND